MSPTSGHPQNLQALHCWLPHFSKRHLLPPSCLNQKLGVACLFFTPSPNQSISKSVSTSVSYTFKPPGHHLPLPGLGHLKERAGQPHTVSCPGSICHTVASSGSLSLPGVTCSFRLHSGATWPLPQRGLSCPLACPPSCLLLGPRPGPHPVSAHHPNTGRGLMCQDPMCFSSKRCYASTAKRSNVCKEADLH